MTQRGIMCSWAALGVGLGLILGGCSTAHYQKSADKETYRIIQEKSPAVPNADPEFTIEEVPAPDLGDLPEVTELDPALGEAAEAERGARIISLEKALELAVQHNRTYQNQKELLYLTALSLTLDRYRYTPIFAGGARGTYQRSTAQRSTLSTTGALAQAAPELVRDLGALAGTPAALLSRYAALAEEAVSVSGLGEPRTEIVDQRSVSAQTAVGVGLLLKGGAQIAIDLTSNFLRFLTGDPNVSTSSALAASITQPLWRGAGSKIAAEQLTQAERDVLYALRDYTRFRQEFTVQVASEYYSVLRTRDVLRNNYANYVAFLASAERDRALVAEGRKARAELGRIEQAVLNAENNWTDATRSYRRTLDNFKIRLGLPVDAPIVLDQNELETLKEQGLRHWEVPVEDAVEVALVSRVDLYNARDRVEDAGRRVEVAANQLRPDLDLIASANVDSKPGDRFQELDFQRARWAAGLDLDLPLNRKAERNAYRTALINLERGERALDLEVDNVKLSVRDAWRNLDQARRTYEIRKLGVQINETRVEEQELLAELGQGDALNLVDAQNDLTAARNQLTEALVAHTIARLEFWRDMGILFIKEKGKWEEITDEVESQT